MSYDGDRINGLSYSKTKLIIYTLAGTVYKKLDHKWNLKNEIKTFFFVFFGN